MPTQGSLTNAGAAGLMMSGAPLSGYLQIGRDTLPVADWQTATSVPGAFRALPITRAIVATQTTIQALDDEDAQAYDDLASIGFWNADPATPGAELWWLGTAAAGEVLSVKTLNNDLIWTVALMLTPAQVANLSFDVSIETVPEATETVFGITRYATDAQAGASEANASDERTPTIAKLWAWWNALSIAVSKIPNLPASKITSGVLGTSRIPNLTAAKITSGILAVARIPNLAASKITSGTMSAWRDCPTPVRTADGIVPGHGDEYERQPWGADHRRVRPRQDNVVTAGRCSPGGVYEDGSSERTSLRTAPSSWCTSHEARLTGPPAARATRSRPAVSRERRAEVSRGLRHGAGGDRTPSGIVVQPAPHLLRSDGTSTAHVDLTVSHLIYGNTPPGLQHR